jgi:hypothetical protein
MRRAVVVLAVVAAASTGAWITRSSSSELTVPAAGTGARVSSTLVLDPPYNQTQFAPPSETDAPALTAAEALERFREIAPGFRLPPDIRAQLGRYTAATRFRDRLAWGFSWHECMTARSSRGRQPFTPPPNDPCTFWLFLDADTGEMLEAFSQLGG